MQALHQIGSRTVSNFIHSLAVANNGPFSKELQATLKNFILYELDTMDKYQVIKQIDMFKYISDWMDAEIKGLLETKLDKLKNEKLGQSEEEELSFLHN